MGDTSPNDCASTLAVTPASAIVTTLTDWLVLLPKYVTDLGFAPGLRRSLLDGLYLGPMVGPGFGLVHGFMIVYGRVVFKPVLASRCGCSGGTAGPPWPAPSPRDSVSGWSPGRINRLFSGRGVYFDDPDGHNMEVMTRRYVRPQDAGGAIPFRTRARARLVTASKSSPPSMAVVAAWTTP